MDKLVENILNVYRASTFAEKREGLTWYSDARKVCQRLANKYHQPLEVVCYITAALSPNNRWQRNLINTETVLRLHHENRLTEMVRRYKFDGDKDALKGVTSTYTVNLLKAFSILATRYFSHLKGLKTNNFAKNLFLDRNDDNVTIDFHVFSIANDFRYTVNSIKSTVFRPKQYHIVAEAYRTAAKKVGIMPKQMQAICWVAWRNLDKVK